LSGLEEAKIVGFAMKVAREVDAEWVAVALAWMAPPQAVRVMGRQQESCCSTAKDWLLRKHGLEHE
jgi:hypothetical protein